MRVLVTGASGQVGVALRSLVPSNVELLACTRVELDIADVSAVNAAVAAFQPDAIINAAAYTAVDAAEREPEQAMRGNVDGPHALAMAASARDGCRLIHISSDYVFDGASTVPYRIDSPTSPLSLYGRSKLEGERAVLGCLADRAVVIRSSWVYSAQGRNFVLTMLRLMKSGAAPRVVNDQVGSPTHASSLARALWRVVQLPKVHGILHWTDAGAITWYDFAVAIEAEARRMGIVQRELPIMPISSTEYSAVATRPCYSVLDLDRSKGVLGLDPVPWRDALRRMIETMPR